MKVAYCVFQLMIKRFILFFISTEHTYYKYIPVVKHQSQQYIYRKYFKAPPLFTECDLIQFILFVSIYTTF